MRLHISLNISKKGAFFGLLILAIGASVLFLTQKVNNKSPLPTNIKNQVNFKVVYPSSRLDQIDSASYKYQSDQKVLSFNTNFAGSNIVFTEQPTPLNLGSDTAAYYPALGVHPYAQFKTDLGLVALAKFYHSGTLKPFGQSAIIVSQGTLLTSHSDKNLTNEQWKSLFDNLKITK